MSRPMYTSIYFYVDEIIPIDSQDRETVWKDIIHEFSVYSNIGTIQYISFPIGQVGADRETVWREIHTVHTGFVH